MEWGGDVNTSDVQNLTHVERLCSYLIDVSLDDVQVRYDQHFPYVVPILNLILGYAA